MSRLRKIRCPVCRTFCDWDQNAFRPFCSAGCKEKDLGKWASEQYRISEQIDDESSPEPKQTEE